MKPSEKVTHAPVEVVAIQPDVTDLVAKAAMIEKIFTTSFISTDRHSEYQ
jgi:hypothetical protein